MLNRIPDRFVDDRVMLAIVDRALVLDLTQVERTGDDSPDCRLGLRATRDHPALLRAIRLRLPLTPGQLLGDADEGAEIEV